MKLTDGLFNKVFDEIALEYPDVENEHWIVDIGAAKLADTPEAFDVIVMPNLYGDILSEVAAKIRNAWLRTIEERIHTADIYSPEASSKRVGTTEFAAAVIARLTQLPQTFVPSPTLTRLKFGQPKRQSESQQQTKSW